MSALIRWLSWWPLLVPIAAICSVIVADEAGARWYMHKPMHETLAMILTGMAVGAFAVRVRAFPHPWHILLLILAIACCLREWHFAGTDVGIYVAIAMFAIASLVLHRPLLAALDANRRFKIWLFATAFAYVLGVLIARRVFREGRIPLLPNEDAIHIYYEEVIENIAHLSLFITAMIGVRRTP